MKNIKTSIGNEENLKTGSKIDKVTIQTGENGVTFFGNGDELYHIHDDILPKIAMVKDIKFSQCIWDISAFEWATKELFYELASIIAKRFPANSIDWQSMFSVFEESEIVHQAYKLQNKSITKKHDQTSEGIQETLKAGAIDFISFSDEFNWSDIRQKVKHQIDEKLKQYSVVK